MPSTTALALLGLASSLLPQAFAQTWTSCNPLNQTDCPVDAAFGTNATFSFNETSADSAIWNTTAGTVDYTSTGAEFTINERGESPTISSNFYIFFGKVSVIMKSAAGQGIVSSIVLESDDLDEVDFEWIGGNNTHWETNYFGKGNTTSYDRAVWYPVDDPQGTFHNYTVDWTKEKIDWYADGNLVRTLMYADANGGDNFPQTPMAVKIGIWAGGDPDANDYWTVQWAGGETDYKDTPYTMTVQSVYIEDYTTAKSYKYGDETGSWESIIVNNGTSAAEKEMTEPHTLAEHWAALPAAARVVIPVVCAASVAGVLAVLAFCCIKHRREGRKVHKIADEQWQKEQEELLEYKNKMRVGEFAIEGGSGKRF
ncbi:glycoside hydrolase family 16 protein [Saccharata proteae CBS 121410]|uniref:chitinase n=1 Tax=Saccharata proteae CBS 121410 TaxID=1314787 RepID=A0A9P4LVA7_9PEZI|nr:glycoside hydrolase family 16 protein [Saccharata proteae CBS 121410]